MDSVSVSVMDSVSVSVMIGITTMTAAPHAVSCLTQHAHIIRWRWLTGIM
jgi:hypothetical protein